MKWLKYFLFICIVLVHHKAIAQYQYPLKEIPGLAATFGEQRVGHYHAGIDLKVFGNIGTPVKAIGNGTIFRIKVSPYGYGKALYLQLNNGHICVYAHLDRFSAEIEKIVRQQQASNKKFRVDLILKEKKIRVKKGEIIAYAGKTGTIHPHLHFELRSPQHKPYNPFYTNLSTFFKDTIAPHISDVLLIPLNQESYVNYSHAEKRIKPNRIDSIYYFFGQIAVEASVFDRAGVYNNQNNIYSKTLVLDQDTIFHRIYDTVDFSTTYQVDLDNNFEKNQKEDRIFTRFYDAVSYFKDDHNLVDGIIHTPNLLPGKHQLKIICNDFFGNQTFQTINFFSYQSNFLPQIQELSYQKDTLTIISDIPPGLNFRVNIINPSTEERYEWIPQSVQAVEDILYQFQIVDQYQTQALYTGDRLIEMQYLDHDTSLISSDIKRISIASKFKSSLNDPVLNQQQPEFEFMTHFLKVKFPMQIKNLRSFERIKKKYSIHTYHLQGQHVVFYLDYRNLGQIADSSDNFVEIPQISSLTGEDFQYQSEDSLFSFIIPQESQCKQIYLYCQKEQLTAELNANQLGERSDAFHIYPDFEILKSSMRIIFYGNFNDKDGIYRIQNNHVNYLNSQIIANGIEAKSGKFGQFAVFRDTIAPNLTPVNFSDQCIIKRKPCFKLKIKDEGSGFNDYTIKTFLDQNQIVFEYDGPRNLIFYQVRKPLTSGNHALKIEIEDHCHNKTMKTFNFKCN